MIYLFSTKQNELCQLEITNKEAISEAILHLVLFFYGDGDDEGDGGGDGDDSVGFIASFGIIQFS